MRAKATGPCFGVCRVDNSYVVPHSVRWNASTARSEFVAAYPIEFPNGWKDALKEGWRVVRVRIVPDVR